METQKDMILKWLETGEPITPLDALQEFGCFRLGGRINDLRNEGYPIMTEMITRNKKTFARYWLKDVYDKRREKQIKKAEDFCEKVFA